VPTTLTPTTLSRAGYDHTTNAVSAASGGNNWANTGNEVLVVTNGSGSTIAVTETTPALTDGQAVTAKTVSVLAGKTAMIGPFPPSVYNDGSNLAGVTYSAVTSVTVSVIRFPG